LSLKTALLHRAAVMRSSPVPQGHLSSNGDNIKRDNISFRTGARERSARRVSGLHLVSVFW
ncbi:MAG: hypothetical protein AAFN00_10415, partial [Cyanobacteria bacterium J06558_2]